ncbi:GNAT family N-acetyltransferase [Enterococcus rotai]|uniref:GNAT family N-acetyltransferase n=1 Tax=Enterococcus rotai TaxID=118060 RepID=UPI0035C6843F
MALIIRRFSNNDATKIALLLKRNFLEINSNDYPLVQMHKLAAEYTPEKISTQAIFGHTYVAEINDTLVGTGTICPFWNSQTESIILSLFVQPEFHRQGIGSAIMKYLEQDEFYLRANRIEVPASRTAKEFYLHLGYQLKYAEGIEDENGYIRMEKRR